MDKRDKRYERAERDESGQEGSARITGVFLDWAGTVVDHGSVAPVKAIENVFAEAGVTVPRQLIRRYMGLAKKDHIRKLLNEQAISECWLTAHKARPQESDVDQLYRRFEPQMMEQLAGYAKVIPGAVETVQALREQGTKTAGTTGYTRPMLETLEIIAAQQGYCIDQSLCPEDVGAGRPYPWMCYRLALDLRIYPLSCCVKVGDTESDIHEGINAGMWTIGLTRSGNSIGLTEAEWGTLDADRKHKMLDVADHELRSAGADYTAESIADVLPLVDEIEKRIQAGERPARRRLGIS